MLTSKDVVRHPLVQKIVQAYENFEKKTEKGSHRSYRDTKNEKSKDKRWQKTK